MISPPDLRRHACQRKDLLPLADDCVALSQMPLSFDLVHQCDRVIRITDVTFTLAVQQQRFCPFRVFSGPVAVRDQNKRMAKDKSS